MGIITSISLALSTCVLFFSVMQSVYGAQSSKITFILIIFAVTSTATVFATDIIPSIY